MTNANLEKDKRLPDAKTSEVFDKRKKSIAEIFEKESDRGCAIIGAEILANDLESLLRSAFRRDRWTERHVVDALFKGYGPISSLAAKADVAFGFGLVPRVLYDRVSLIRRIRNCFAHSEGLVTFADPRVSNMVGVLGSEMLLSRTIGPKVVVHGNRRGRLVGDAVRMHRLRFLTPVIHTSSALGFLEQVIRENEVIRATVRDFERKRVWCYD